MIISKNNLPIILIALALILFAYFFNPFQPVKIVICPFFTLTGLYCPGCGALRASHSLLHGNILSAWKYNSFVVLIMPFLIVYFVMHVKALRKNLPPPETLIKPVWIWLLFAVIMLFWILRNIDIEPFKSLAPG